MTNEDAVNRHRNAIIREVEGWAAPRMSYGPPARLPLEINKSTGSHCKASYTLIATDCADGLSRDLAARDRKGVDGAVITGGTQSDIFAKILKRDAIARCR